MRSLEKKSNLKMEIKSLAHCSFEEVYNCFLEAFSDYIIPFKTTPELSRQRWQAAGIDFSKSVGCFDNGVLKGFMVIAIAQHEGTLCAYNGGTGVIPSFRGNQATKKMYQWLIEKLQTSGIRKHLLEVIQGNDKALFWYQKVGFKISRPLWCYEGTLGLKNPISVPDITIQHYTDFELEPFSDWIETRPAWEFTLAVHRRLPTQNNILIAKIEDKIVGYLVYNKASGVAIQFAVHPQHRRKGIGHSMFIELAKHYELLRIINVDGNASILNTFIQSLGLEVNIKQYEMCLKI